MKRIFLLVVFVAFCTIIFAQADSTLIQIGQHFGVNSTILYWIGFAVTFIIGHWAIPKKWTSYLHWIVNLVYWLYISLKWLDDKTNNEGTKSSTTPTP